MSDASLTLRDIMELDNEVIKDIEAMTKKKYVEKHHQRKISFIQSRNIWRTYIGEPRKEVTRKEEYELICFLYDYYKEQETAELPDTSFHKIFEEMQSFRENIEKLDSNTIKRDNFFYKKFITDEFGGKEISSITTDDLNYFIGNQAQEYHPKEKAFNGFVGIFSKTFKYAMQKKYIDSNPYNDVEKNRFYKFCDRTIKQGDEKIFTRYEIEMIQNDIYEWMGQVDYDPYGFAILMSIETGMRLGEIPPLRWKDITSYGIHIHCQQKYYQGENGGEYIELPYTKDERVHPHDGRYFPVTDKIEELLYKIKNIQESLGIYSDYIFCRENGEWILKRHLERRIRKCCKKLGYDICNNHAFRMSLNSNVLIPLGIPVQQRAYILGHSVETNLRHYTHMRLESLNDITMKLNGSKENQGFAVIHAPYMQDFAQMNYTKPYANRKKSFVLEG